MTKHRWDLLRMIIKPHDLVKVTYRNNWQPVYKRERTFQDFPLFIDEKGLRFCLYGYEEKRISYKSIVRVKILPVDEPDDAVLTPEGWISLR